MAGSLHVLVVVLSHDTPCYPQLIIVSIKFKPLAQDSQHHSIQQQKNLLLLLFSRVTFLPAYPSVYWAVSSSLAVVVPGLRGFSVSGPLWDSSSSADFCLIFFWRSIWLSLIMSTTEKNNVYIFYPLFADIEWYGSLCFSIIVSSFFLSKFLSISPRTCPDQTCFRRLSTGLGRHGCPGTDRSIAECWLGSQDLVNAMGTGDIEDEDRTNSVL